MSKKTLVTPVFKKGDSNMPENFRPIAIVPIISKLIETCIVRQFYDFFSDKNLLYVNQFGFMPKGSTTKAVEKVVEFVLNGFENNLVVGGSLLDLSKAFDTVSHSILCKKLEYYGIQNVALNLIVSYLSDRTQVVKIDKSFSSPNKVIAGVPQGSVLGPFLFVVFVNDFYVNVPCFSVLYADDTTLLSSDKDFNNIKNKLQCSIDQARLWYNSNQLGLNESKTVNILFSLKNAVGSEFSNLLEPAKLLGITLDSKLGWNPHVDVLCKKLARVTYLIRKLKDCVSLDVLLLAYYGLFNCHLNYGLRLWGNCADVNRVFVWQKKVIRCIVGLNNRNSCKESFINLKIMTLPSMYVYCNLMYVRENIDNFSKHYQSHDYNTRNKHNLVTPSIRLHKSYKSHSYQQYLYLISYH